MSTKHELASYLASLNSLLDAQDDAGTALRSQTLAGEYERTWKELKELIAKEQEDATRTS